MKYTFQHIIPLFLGLLFAGCISELDGPQGNLRGSFSVSLSADSLGVEVETRAAHPLTEAQQATFRLTLTDREGTVWENKLYTDVTLEDRTQPVADGYVLTAQNCTAQEAESLNDGWGQRRFRGQSQAFAVKQKEDTRVTVNCTMANAGLCVDFDEAFTSFFTEGYMVTLVDSRNLRFDASTADRVAYYNVADDTGSHQVRLLVNASAGWDGMLRTIERTLTLQQGRICRLHIRKGEPQEGTIDGVFITYDETFDEGTTEEVELE